MTLMMLLLPLVTAANASATMSNSQRALIRVRACEIQQRDRIAPTFCYPANAEKQIELDSMCVHLSANAERLPKFDHFTSKPCRAAIEKRAKDLAYAGQRDALR